MSLRILLSAIVPLLALSNALPFEDSANRHSLLPRSTVTCNDGGPADVVSQDLTDFFFILSSVADGIIPSGVTVTEPSINIPSLLENRNLPVPVGTHASVAFAVGGQAVFTSTHLSYSTLASAMQEYQTTCCGVFPMCIGGSVDGVRGDTGQSLSVNFGHSGNCQELNDCFASTNVVISG